jgi:hypothetical protein
MRFSLFVIPGNDIVTTASNGTCGNFAIFPLFLECLSKLVYSMPIKPQPSPRVEQEINTPSSFDDFVVTERVFDLR